MPDLLADYPRPHAAYHELLDAQGQVRPHWRRLLDQLQRSTPAQLQQRQATLARQIQENGVTYNVYADPQGSDRPWALDLLPNLIDAEEWQTIAAGVAQRAGLLNRVLADLYGPQQLLRDGLLPAELEFGHNNFLWPCQGVQVPGDTWLHLYAVDLARAPDGRWWVLADRTQAPSGAGYALENRQIVSRVLPELYRDLRVQYLAGFFRTLQEQLREQAPSEGETPLVVLLTPGRFNETYFEHLYLARQLGFPLVEGSDLTVRDDTLYLKTLDGLQRVHALLRRLDDDFCDPLELRTDSALGVPGLLEVVRQGRVLVANALGSGVLESPGLLGFMPAIAEQWLGEELLLPSIATWWCGEPPVLEEALHGKKVGDKFEVKLQPEDAFGDYDDRLLFLEPRHLFPEQIEEGMGFEGLPAGCNPSAPKDRLYFISDIYPDHVVLDGNHPLAGMALRLHVKVRDVREASDEEIEAGSVGSSPFDVQLQMPPPGRLQ